MGYEIIPYHGIYNRSERTQAVKYIVIHYTGGTGSALNNCQYFSGGNRNASAHYFIDDSAIYEYADPKRYYTWHCGDGRGAYGITNGNSIGIEVVSNGEDFSDREIDRLAYLVGKLMSDFGIDADHVVRHYDASRKQCPAPYVDQSKWAALKERITGSAKPGDSREDDLKPISIPTGTYPVYRVYNPNTGDHHFTSSKGEYDALVSMGWNGEGEAWTGADTGEVVYRLYNPNAGDHFFTASFDEASSLVSVGWSYEGSNFASARSGEPVYRLYNQSNGDHMFTASKGEYDSLGNAGWKQEGVAFHAA